MQNPTAPLITQKAAPTALAGMVDKKARRDSLLAAKATRDSLLQIAKTAKRDSLIASRHSRDSLQAIQKAYWRDSLQAAKISKDSATAAQKLVAQKAPAKDNALVKQTAQPVPGNASGVTLPQPLAANHPVSGTTSQIRKLREVSLKISRKLVYLDIGKDGQTDTITLFVFFETADTSKSKNGQAVAGLIGKKAVKLDSSDQNGPAVREKMAQRASESGCGQLATEADLEFLRSAILKANTEDTKISLASSAFEQKCFSVAQIRVLADLFVSDKAKYRLMEASKLHIADPEHFRELVNMYTDKNFQRKFLSMTEKRS